MSSTTDASLTGRFLSMQWQEEQRQVLKVPRTACGAALVRCCTRSNNNNNTAGNTSTSSMTTRVLLAGGKTTTTRASNSNNSKLLDTIELFDPQKHETKILPCKLTTPRVSCAAFPLDNCRSEAAIEERGAMMCIVGGRDQKKRYLSSIEVVSETSCRVLPTTTHSLPEPRAMFGTAVVGQHVFVLGGKCQDAVLDTVLMADLSSFLFDGDVSSSSHSSSIWKQVGTLTSPRMGFSVVYDGDVLWLLGGFDGAKLLKSAEIYHPRLHQSILHPSATLSVARTGTAACTIGKNILLFGARGSSSAIRTQRSSSMTSQQEDGGAASSSLTTLRVKSSAEFMLRDNVASDKQQFVAIPNLETEVKDAVVFQIGYSLYIMGGSDKDRQPLGTVMSLDLISVRSALVAAPIGTQGDATGYSSSDTAGTPRLFEAPRQPRPPAPPREPVLYADKAKFRASVDQWKTKMERSILEYRSEVSKAEEKVERLHAHVIADVNLEIAKTREHAQQANPDKENKRDAEKVAAQIKTLQRELEERVASRNKDFEDERANSTVRIHKLQSDIVACNSARDLYLEEMTSNFSAWLTNKNSEISDKESLLGGHAPVQREDNMDVAEDRTKLQDVLEGRAAEPAEVSSNYGKLCTRDYDIANELGSGSFGVVYKGNDFVLSRTFAFKRVPMPTDRPAHLRIVAKTFRREISTLKRVNHPNIIALYGFHLDIHTDDSFLVYEFAGRGNLAVQLKTENGRLRLPYLRRLRIMTEALRALNFLHTKGCGAEIQHRDIKPENICLTGDFSTKLIDCGLARISEVSEGSSNSHSTHSILSTFGGLAGTEGYCCRRYWNGLRPYQSPCDMYSFGIVMMELIVGGLNRRCKAFPGDFFEHFVESAIGDTILDGAERLAERCDELVVWEEASLGRLCRLAVKCLSKNLKERPTARQLVVEVGNMMLQGELGEIPSDFRPPDIDAASPPCVICNESRSVYIKCQHSHAICSQCITQEAIISSNTGTEFVSCPIVECTTEPFDIKQDLYGVVPKDVYNKCTSEGRIMECLRRIEYGQNRVMSQISNVRKGVNRGLQAMASMTMNATAPCPKLVWIIPDAKVKLNGRKPSTWVTGLTDISIRVYFVCEHSFEPVSTPVRLTVKRKWLRKIAPAVKISLFVLRLATSCVGLPLPVLGCTSLAEQLNIETEFIDSLLEKTDQLFLDSSESLFTDGVSDFDSNRMKTLTGPAYDLLADGVRTGGQLGWQDEMKPVMNTNNARIWVKNEFVTHRNYNVPSGR